MKGKAIKAKATKVKATKTKMTKAKKSDVPVDAYKDDWAEGRTVAARDPVRAQLQSEIEAFLAEGGKITRVEANLRADPPRKPTSNYGSQPI